MTWKQVWNSRSNGIALACSLIAAVAWAAPEAARPATAAGESAVRGGDFARARAEAVEAALLATVEVAAGRILDPSVASRCAALLHARLAEKSRDLVRDFKLLKETNDAGIVRVEVSATPNAIKIRDELTRWGFLYEGTRRPRFGVMRLKDRGARGSAGEASSARWTARFVGVLRDMGYTAFDTETGESDIAIVGSFSVLAQRTLAVELRAVYRKTQAELAAFSGNIAIEKSSDLAMGVAATRLLERILPPWTRQSGEGKFYEVTFVGLTSARPLKAVMESITTGRDNFLSARELAFAPGSVTLEVGFSGTPVQLVAALGRLAPAGTKFDVGAVEGNTITVNVR